jgi:hypothetical protein
MYVVEMQRTIWNLFAESPTPLGLQGQPRGLKVLITFLSEIQNIIQTGQVLFVGSNQSSKGIGSVKVFLSKIQKIMVSEDQCTFAAHVNKLEWQAGLHRKRIYESHVQQRWDSLHTKFHNS